MQLSLFETGPDLPEGFRYQPGLLDEETEDRLIRQVSELEFRQFRWHQYTGKRRTVAFGWSYSFDQGKIETAGGFPEFLADLRGRVARWSGIRQEALVQGLVTEYQPGAAIGWHRDAPPFGVVLGVSLLSDCCFRLRLEKEKVQRELTVERRSVYMMSGPARTVWQHGIPPAKATRYSITFRTLR
jgi:alkylated DNA repair dioxygenase AlkB